MVNQLPSMDFKVSWFCLFIWVLTSLYTHCISHIMTGSFMGRGNQYIQLIKVLYCKLSNNGKPLLPISEMCGKSVTTLPPRPQGKLASLACTQRVTEKGILQQIFTTMHFFRLSYFLFCSASQVHCLPNFISCIFWQ